MNKKIIFPSFNKELTKDLKDPEFKKYFHDAGRKLELAYKMACLREKRKMSQEQLAKKIKTTQSSIARMESGGQNFSTEMLARVADALGCNLQVDFILREEPNKPYDPFTRGVSEKRDVGEKVWKKRG
ncbi:helix-turn-helix transcriptional regulator [Candidatus Gribaldobacteria bacterium]|nr:helix-turn-helix transcriptional regulator [Candidatus Gribaldobacteria bacterium]